MTRSVATLSVEERAVTVQAGPVTLDGDLSLPLHARAVVLFAHGSGSSRFSSRNKRVASRCTSVPSARCSSTYSRRTRKSSISTPANSDSTSGGWPSG